MAAYSKYTIGWNWSFKFMKVSESESVRIWKCQNLKVLESERVRTGYCQNFLKPESVRISRLERIQNWKVSESESVRFFKILNVSESEILMGNLKNQFWSLLLPFVSLYASEDSGNIEKRLRIFFSTPKYFLDSFIHFLQLYSDIQSIVNPFCYAFELTIRSFLWAQWL